MNPTKTNNDEYILIKFTKEDARKNRHSIYKRDVTVQSTSVPLRLKRVT